MSVYPGNILTATAATVTSQSATTRTWEWLRNGTAIPAATASTYTITQADIGALLIARQTETNFVGRASASSLPVGPIQTFSPSILFSANEPGLWLDPSDLTTLFQDTAGTTPVTTPGQSVALALDKSRGLVLGPENAPNNGLFNVATGWTLESAAVTITGGRLRFTNAPSGIGNRAYFIFGRTAGTTHRFSITVESLTAPVVVDFGAVVYTVSAPGTYSWVGQVTAAITNGISMASLGSAVISAISSRELPGNHATQATAGNRPLYALLPANGVRNMMNGSANPANNTFWNASQTLNGITLTRVGTGVDANGLPYADFSVVGTATLDTYIGTTGNSSSLIYSAIGQTYTTSCIAQIISGTAPPAGSGPRVEVIELSAAQAFLGGSAATHVTTTEQVNTTTHTTANASVAFVRGSLVVETRTGVTVNYTFRMRAIQFERGSTRTAYQFNYAATNIAQPPFAQVGALLFDGSDDFLQTPSVDFATATSDGQTRRNVLNFPTLFDDAAWQKQNSTISANSAVAPDGTSTADKLQETAVTAAFSLGIAPTMSFNTTYTFSVYMKAAERSFGVLNIFTGAASCWTWYNLSSGTVGTIGAGATASISNVGNGWYRCILTIATAASGSPNVAMWPATADNVLTYAGTAGSGILVWGAQLEIGSTATAFQNIGTDKMTVFAGVRKLDSTGLTIVELGPDVDTTNGSFALYANAPGGPNVFQLRSRGTLLVARNLTLEAPVTGVVTGLLDISGRQNTIRVNGVTGLNAADQGTGNYRTDILYIGRRSGSPTPLNGYLYSLIVRGAATPANLITATETWVNSRTGAY